MNPYEITVNTFDKLAEKYQSKYMDFDFYEDTYDTFLSYLEKDNADILEIACGPGNITKYLLDRCENLNIYGVDLAPNMVALARKNNPNAMFDIVDSRNVSSINRKFDAILCGFGLPYLSKHDVEKLLCDLRSLINIHGILYLSTMEDEDSRSGFQTSSTGDQVYTHYHQFKHLAACLKASGFELLLQQRKNFPVESGKATTDLFIYARAV